MTIPLEKLKPGVLVRTTIPLWLGAGYTKGKISESTIVLLLDVDLPKSVKVLLHNGEVHMIYCAIGTARIVRYCESDELADMLSWFEEV